MTSGTMSLHVLETLSNPGGRHNEDRVFHQGPTAWVLDGATGLTDSNRTSSPSDAAWLVETAVQTLTSQTDDSLDGQLSQVVSALRSYYPLAGASAHKSDVPSAVAAGIQVRGLLLNFVHFGDCALIVLNADSSEIYRSPESPLQKLDRGVIESISNLRLTQGLSFTEARREVLPLLRENRALANTIDGYGNISVFGENPSPREQGALEVESGSYGLLVSDGFMALVEDYGRYSSRELVMSARKHGLLTLYTELRDIEAGDLDCVTYPRLKTGDDASAILFELG